MKKNKGLYKKEILKIESERLEKESEELQKKYDERFAIMEDFIKNEIPDEFVKSFLKEIFQELQISF